MNLKLRCRTCHKPFIGVVCEEGCCQDQTCGPCEMSLDLWDEEMKGRWW